MNMRGWLFITAGVACAAAAAPQRLPAIQAIGGQGEVPAPDFRLAVPDLPKAAPVEAEKPLILRESGRRFRTHPEPGRPAETALYVLTFGDTSAQDQKSLGRSQAGFGVFAMNAAQYFPNGDGTWRLFSFKLPNEAFLDPAAIAERDRWRDCLLTPAVRKALEDPYAREDFTEPCGYILKKMRVPRSELPPPLGRVSAAALEPILGIFRYHGDGTMKLVIKDGLDEDGPAQEVFHRLAQETGPAR